MRWSAAKAESTQITGSRRGLHSSGRQPSGTLRVLPVWGPCWCVARVTPPRHCPKSLVLKVSHWLGSPELKPLAVQYLRIFDEPWVQASG